MKMKKIWWWGGVHVPAPPPLDPPLPSGPSWLTKTIMYISYISWDPSKFLMFPSFPISTSPVLSLPDWPSKRKVPQNRNLTGVASFMDFVPHRLLSESHLRDQRHLQLHCKTESQIHHVLLDHVTCWLFWPPLWFHRWFIPGLWCQLWCESLWRHFTVLLMKWQVISYC